MKTQHTNTGMTKTLKMTTSRIGKDAEQLEVSYVADENVKR